MTITVIVHIANEDPIIGEVEEMPTLSDTMIIIAKPRKRDGKDLHYLDSDVTTAIWPCNRITF